MRNSDVYQYPRYYDLGYRWNTDAECEFIDACLNADGPAHPSRILDIGCGSGRHLRGLARLGYRMTGIDPSPQMVAYARAHAADSSPPIDVAAGDLRRLEVPGPFDAACCLMDTFRFLLTEEDILEHFRALAQRLVPGGLYITDFWVPKQRDQIGREIEQWEQTEGDLSVRVCYVQHPDSIDPVAQTFEDELIFQVRDGETVRRIQGGRTRTRLILPQEFRALLEASGVWTLLDAYSDFDRTKPFHAASMSWRMVSVLQKR